MLSGLPEGITRAERRHGGSDSKQWRDTLRKWRKGTVKERRWLQQLEESRIEKLECLEGTSWPRAIHTWPKDSCPDGCQKTKAEGDVSCRTRRNILAFRNSFLALKITFYKRQVDSTKEIFYLSFQQLPVQESWLYSSMPS